MGFQFDHVVHFVESPEEAKEELLRLGLHAVSGGKHESFGTYNSLSYFGLSYIELIGVFDKSLAELKAEAPYSLRESIAQGGYVEALTRIALRSENLEAEAERFRALGLEVHGPTPMSRKRTDGSVLTWKLLFVGKPDEQPDLPFFIQWEQSDEDRKADLKKQGTMASHNLGEVALSSVGIAVHDREATVERWARYLGLEVAEVFADEGLQATGQRLKLDGGDIVFYSPAGEGPVSDVLRQRGEKPFLIEFSGAGKEQVQQVKGAIYRFKK
ncbi:MAG: VOC family protein [Bacillus sp. (in: firmicutes)]